MPQFSSRSLNNLSQCHPDLRRVADEAIKRFDFTVIQGHRGRDAQEDAFKRGASKARWLQSPHNYKPALAFDAVPYPLDWSDIPAFEQMGAAMLEASRVVGVSIVWGGNWRSFKDYPHFELVNWRALKK